VRLDHLLSKELLALFGVSRRRFRDGCSRPVCSWVEHLTRLPFGCLVSSTAFGSGTVLGVGVGACTLLGPEGLDVGLSVSSGLIPLLAVAGVGVGTARTLRTTQWTRASLN
jgi:hypothetical protein